MKDAFCVGPKTSKSQDLMLPHKRFGMDPHDTVSQFYFLHVNRARTDNMDIIFLKHITNSKHADHTICNRRRWNVLVCLQYSIYLHLELGFQTIEIESRLWLIHPTGQSETRLSCTVDRRLCQMGLDHNRRVVRRNQHAQLTVARRWGDSSLRFELPLDSIFP